MLASLLTYLKILAVSSSISLSGAVSIPTPDVTEIEITIGGSQSDEEVNSASNYRLIAPARVEALEDLWNR